MNNLDFNSYNLKHWKEEYLNKETEIVVTTIEYLNDSNFNIRENEYHFKDWDELNNWLNDPINLTGEEFIQTISENNICTFNYEKFNKQFENGGNV